MRMENKSGPYAEQLNDTNDAFIYPTLSHAPNPKRYSCAPLSILCWCCFKPASNRQWKHLSLLTHLNEPHACVHSSVTWDPYRTMTRIVRKCDTYQKLYDYTMEISSIRECSIQNKRPARLNYFRTFIITFRMFFFRCLSLLFVYFLIIHVFLVWTIPDAIIEKQNEGKGKEMIASVTQRRGIHSVSGSNGARKYKVQSLVPVS